MKRESRTRREGNEIGRGRGGEEERGWGQRKRESRTGR